jgi:hypothetical protein
MVLSDEITDQVNARKAVEVSEKCFVFNNNMLKKLPMPMPRATLYSLINNGLKIQASHLTN